ncbi:MAG: hypothetical protein QOI85_1301 [Chloroflexota bacterium]|nr:hypothetical protein [Chloroflexota bacterium]
MLAGMALTLALTFMVIGRTSAGGITTVGLGLAEPFAVLAGTPAITNVGLTEITGDVGIHPAASVTGFPPGIVNGTIHAADQVALDAKNALVTAYNDAAGRAPTATVPAGALMGTLFSGVYNAGGVTLTVPGALILDAQNNADAVWIFQATSDLVTASASSVQIINGGSPCNVFWQVTSSATLGSGSTLVGNILALTSITMTDDVTIDGRALARNGTVTLINDTIDSTMCAAAGPVPTPTPTPTLSPVAPTPSATPLLPNTSADQGQGVEIQLSVLVLVGASAALLGGSAATLRRSTVRKRRSVG